MAAVRGVGLADSCYVISSDSKALELARSQGAIPVREATNRGVNTAVHVGIRRAEESEYLVIPADLPLLSSSDLKRVIALKSEAADIVMSPSQAFDGTNLLLFSKAKRVRLSYDSTSFWNHLEDAAKRGHSLAVYTGKRVIFDVDTVHDLRKLAEARINSQPVAFAKKALKRWTSS